jgi:LysM repeat protein
MSKKIVVPIGLAIAATIFIALCLALQMTSSPGRAQATYQTPTPGSDGRILYTVNPGDTCLGIALLTGVPIERLRELNDLKGDCVLQPGQKLLLGLAGPPEQQTNTPGPSPTPTPLLPTATPQKGYGEICIVLYDDVNGNALREDGEGMIAGGAVSITDRSGSYSHTETTTAGPDPLCIQNVPEGEYNVSVAVPQGYNPTTALNYALTLQAGDKSTLDFGAQQDAQAPAADGNGGSGRSPLLGLLGGLLLLAGIGLGVYVRQLRR